MKLNLKRAEEILPGDLIVVDHELVQVTHLVPSSGGGWVYIDFSKLGEFTNSKKSRFRKFNSGHYIQIFDAGVRQTVFMGQIKPGDILLRISFVDYSMGWTQVEEVEYRFDSDQSLFTFSLLRCRQPDGEEVELARLSDAAAHRITVIDAIPPELKRMEDVEEGETIFVYKSLQLITGTVCNKTQDEADTFFGFTEEPTFTRHRIHRKAFAEVVLQPPLAKRSPTKGHLSIEMIID